MSKRSTALVETYQMYSTSKWLDQSLRHPRYLLVTVGNDPQFLLALFCITPATTVSRSFDQPIRVPGECRPVGHKIRWVLDIRTSASPPQPEFDPIHIPPITWPCALCSHAQRPLYYIVVVFSLWSHVYTCKIQFPSAPNFIRISSILFEFWDAIAGNELWMHSHEWLFKSLVAPASSSFRATNFASVIDHHKLCYRYYNDRLGIKFDDLEFLP